MPAHQSDGPEGLPRSADLPRVPRMVHAPGIVAWLVAAAFLGVGAGVLTLSLEDDLRRRGVTTTAVVTGTTCGPLGGRSQSFDVRADVGDLLFLDCVPSERVRVGQVVRVTYDPRDTTNVRLAGYTDRPLGTGFTVVGSAAALTLAGWVVLDARRGFRSPTEDSRRRAERGAGAARRTVARRRRSDRPPGHRGRHRA